MNMHVAPPVLDRWTPERVELVAALRLQGMPASAIAKELGPDFTRNMVLGMCFRRGLCAKLDAPTRVTAKQLRARERERAKKRWAEQKAERERLRLFNKHHKKRPAMQEAEIVSVEMWNVSFAELRLVGDCKWIEGDPREGTHVYCGRPALQASSYCNGHHRMVYVKSTFRKKAA